MSIIRVSSSSVFSDSRSFFGFIFNLRNVSVQIISLGFVRDDALTASAQVHITRGCITRSSQSLGRGHRHGAQHNGRGRRRIRRGVNSSRRDGG